MVHAAVVFMHAVGVNTLRAWNAELTRDAVHVYHEVGPRLGTHMDLEVA